MRFAPRRGVWPAGKKTGRGAYVARRPQEDKKEKKGIDIGAAQRDKVDVERV